MIVNIPSDILQPITVCAIFDFCQVVEFHFQSPFHISTGEPLSNLMAKTYAGRSIAPASCEAMIVDKLANDRSFTGPQGEARHLQTIERRHMMHFNTRDLFSLDQPFYD